MLTTNAQPLRIISGLRPIQSASSPENSVENTLPSSTAATMTESCGRGQPRCGLQVGHRAADDAHVDAVEQAAQACNQQQKRVVAAHRGGVDSRARGDPAEFT